jgi:hypothetical protein
MKYKESARNKTLHVNSTSITGTTYSQVAGVTVTDTEVTFDFIYLHPRDNTKGEVVCRVTMPRSAAEELSAVIGLTIKQHESSKKN